MVAVGGVALGSGVHARKRPSRPANAEIRPDCGSRLVVTTPTAHRGFCIVFSGVVLGLAGRGIITAEAVMLFSSSLRCGGLRRTAPPMRSRASKNLPRRTLKTTRAHAGQRRLCGNDRNQPLVFLLKKKSVTFSVRNHELFDVRVRIASLSM